MTLVQNRDTFGLISQGIPSPSKKNVGAYIKNADRNCTRRDAVASYFLLKHAKVPHRLRSIRVALCRPLPTIFASLRRPIRKNMYDLNNAARHVTVRRPAAFGAPMLWRRVVTTEHVSAYMNAFSHNTFPRKCWSKILHDSLSTYRSLSLVDKSRLNLIHAQQKLYTN